MKRVDDVQAKPCVDQLIVQILFYRGYSLNVYHLNHIVYIPLKLQQSKQKSLSEFFFLMSGPNYSCSSSRCGGCS